MNSSYSHAQMMGPSPFYYYTPDTKADNRQHGHFSQHPSVPMHVSVYQHCVPTVPSTPIHHSRPVSSSSQHSMMQQVPSQHMQQQYPMYIPSQHPHFQNYTTPVASPRQMYATRQMHLQEQPYQIMEQDRYEHDSYFTPCTPPLSASNSSMGSPCSVDGLQTPDGLAPSFFGFDSVKEGGMDEMKDEQFLGTWQRGDTSPMTPVFVNPNSLIANQASGNGYLSVAAPSTCPSLSSSSSPPHSPFPSSTASPSATAYFEQEIDYCDPRKLVVGLPYISNHTPSSSISLDHQALPTLYSNEEDRQGLEENTIFEYDSISRHGIATFESLSDLESEDGLNNGLVDFGHCDSSSSFHIQRPSTTSSDVSFNGNFDDFEASEQFAVACLPSPSASITESEVRSSKRAKKSKRVTLQEESSIFDCMVESRTFTANMDVTTSASAQEAFATERDATPIATSTGDSSEGNSVNNAEEGRSTSAAPITGPRRGRKQSLTEDPSKTFVCDICQRRFRRQEHLKRHHRSLHTGDKPFGCPDCGKTFSRSDNLAQHARTHSNGTITLDVLEHGELALPLGHPDRHPNEQVRRQSKILFDMAAAAPGSDSSDASESDSASRGKRKRSQ